MEALTLVGYVLMAVVLLVAGLCVKDQADEEHARQLEIEQQEDARTARGWK